MEQHPASRWPGLRPAAALAAAGLLFAACAASPKPAKAPARTPTPGKWQSTLLRDHPLAGRIWLVDEGRFIPPRGLMERVSAHKFVLLGERHDNPDHHRIQAWITKRLIARGRRPALVMEMFRGDQQAAIDTYLASHRGDSTGLGKATGWRNTGWPAWRRYEPIVRPMVSQGLPLIAANLSRGTIRAVLENGFKALTPDRIRTLNLDRPIDAAMLSATDREIVDAHCGALDARKARSFARIQILRDAAFAEAMRRGARRAQGAFLIAGDGHVRRDRGVPFHLRRAGVESQDVFSLGIIEVSGNENGPTFYGAPYGADRPPFDAVWFTPRRARKDLCKSFKNIRKNSML